MVGAHSRTSNTDTKLLIYGLFQKGRVLAQDAVNGRRRRPKPAARTMAFISFELMVMVMVMVMVMAMGSLQKP